MKLSLQFGLNEPKRKINWWQTIKEFPYLVLYKDKKWEFVIYEEDPTKQVDYICTFGEIHSYDPNWHSTEYVDISAYLDNGWGGKCECGAVYTSFPQMHMIFCPKWVKFDG